MVQNLWRVQFQGGDCPPPCPPPEELRGGTKKFSGASRPICPPPPQPNPVSAPVCACTISPFYVDAIGPEILRRVDSNSPPNDIPV